MRESVDEPEWRWRRAPRRRVPPRHVLVLLSMLLLFGASLAITRGERTWPEGASAELATLQRAENNTSSSALPIPAAQRPVTLVPPPVIPAERRPVALPFPFVEQPAPRGATANTDDAAAQQRRYERRRAARRELARKEVVRQVRSLPPVVRSEATWRERAFSNN